MYSTKHVFLPVEQTIDLIRMALLIIAIHGVHSLCKTLMTFPPCGDTEVPTTEPTGVTTWIKMGVEEESQCLLPSSGCGIISNKGINLHKLQEITEQAGKNLTELVSKNTGVGKNGF